MVALGKWIPLGCTWSEDDKPCVESKNGFWPEIVVDKVNCDMQTRSNDSRTARMLRDQDRPKD